MIRTAITSLALLVISTLGLQAANLTWSPETGYQSDEIELSGLLPEEVQKILDLMNQGRRAEEDGRLRAALRKYKRVSKKYPKSQYAPEAISRSADIHMRRNQIDKAFEDYYLLAYVYPNHGSFNTTVGKLYKIAVDRQTTYRGKIFGLFPGFLNTDRAVKYFERIVFIAPYSDYAPLSLMNIASIWAKKKDDTMAIFALDRLITNYPNSFLTPDAYIQLANTHASLVRGPYYDQRNTEDAITYFEDYLIQFPNNQSVGMAETGKGDAENILALSKIKIADFYYYKRSNLRAAKILYSEADTIAPTSKAAERAREMVAKIDEQLGKANESPEIDTKQPTVEQMEEKAKKRAKRNKILGVF